MKHSMSCCSKCTFMVAFRFILGIAIALVGLDHYLNLSQFTGMASSSLGPLTSLGMIWAYILPGLQIVGGLWFAMNPRSTYAAMVLAVAFGSTIIGMLIKPTLGDACLAGCDNAVMGLAQNTLLWLFFFMASVGFACTCNSHVKESI